MELAWIIRGLWWFCLESMIKHAFISALPWILSGLMVDFSHLNSSFIICICFFFLAEVKGIFYVGVVMELAFLVGSWAPLMNRSLQKFWLQWFVLCFTSISIFLWMSIYFYTRSWMLRLDVKFLAAVIGLILKLCYVFAVNELWMFVPSYLALVYKLPLNYFSNE